MSDDKKIASIPLTMGGKCPTCNKPSTLKYRPFCSKRCADLDLGQWLNEGYRIASEEEADLEDYDPE